LPAVAIYAAHSVWLIFRFWWKAVTTASPSPLTSATPEQRASAARSSPFFLHPEIIDEVIKYVHIPKDIAEGVRQFAKQRAAEKAAKPVANQSGEMS
jgi:hypothetical protein